MILFENRVSIPKSDAHVYTAEVQSTDDIGLVLSGYTVSQENNFPPDKSGNVIGNEGGDPPLYWKTTRYKSRY